MSNNTAKYYLGIDPSLQKTGIGIISIDSQGTTTKKAYCVKSNNKLNTLNRIIQMRNSIHTLINTQYPKMSCTSACIEAASHNSTGRHDELGQVRGALRLWIHDTYLTFTHTIPPKSLKKYASKHGDASKKTMIKNARLIGWDIPDKEDDQADAAHLAEIAYALIFKNDITLNRQQLEVLQTLEKRGNKCMILKNAQC